MAFWMNCACTCCRSAALLQCIILCCVLTSSRILSATKLMTSAPISPMASNQVLLSPARLPSPAPCSCAKGFAGMSADAEGLDCVLWAMISIPPAELDGQSVPCLFLPALDINQWRFNQCENCDVRSRADKTNFDGSRKSAMPLTVCGS